MRRKLRNEYALMAGLAALGFALGRRPGLAAGSGLLALGLRFYPEKAAFRFQGRSVVVTGGSRGLGFALAEELLRQGAHVTILARDKEELARAAEKLAQVSASGVLTQACDVTCPEQLQRSFEEAESYFGRIDVLINNAGAITMGPFESLAQEDFEAQLRVHLFAPLQATRLVLPFLRRAGGGRIVNISSVGGKLPVPHMAPYCASKFALSGFSAAVGAELAREGVYVTTVHPGFMRTGSHIQAVFKGDQQKEFAWFASIGLAPLFSMDASRAARKILESVGRGDAEVVISAAAKIGTFWFEAFPELFSSMMRLAARMLPHNTAGEYRTGSESRASFDRSPWSWPLRRLGGRAQLRFNQREKSDAAFNLGMREA